MSRNQTTGRRKQASNSRRHSLATDVMEVAVSGIGGLAIGAALMYLFDPQVGQKRREKVREAAHSAVDASTGALSSLASGVTTAASGVSEQVGELTDRLHHLGDTRDEYTGRIGSAYRGIRGSVGDYLEDLADKARSQFRGASRSARQYSKSLPTVQMTSRESEGFSGTTTAVSAVGALAVGCAAMYFLDPRQGRSRRAYVMQKAGKLVREAGQMARATGRHLANKSKGYYHEASQMMPDVGSKLQSAMGSTRSESSSEQQSRGGEMENEGPAYDLQANTPAAARPNPSAM
jgi:gas vesicle protein